MSRTIPGIKGAPLRKIVSRVYDRGYWTETLSCGHTKLAEDQYSSKFRRCYTCKCERERQLGNSE